MKLSCQKGNYKIEVSLIPQKPGYTEWSEASVYRGDQFLLKIRRNYFSFPYSFLLNHPRTHHDYLICGSDYQGLTIVDLLNLERRDYRPESAKGGFGFCHAEFQVSPDRRFLGSMGCIWGGPYSGRVYDLADPMSLPWPLLFETCGEVIELHWEEEDGSCNFRTTVCVRASDGKFYGDLTDEEMEEEPETEERERIESFESR